jgi:hypothetical protein
MLKIPFTHWVFTLIISTSNKLVELVPLRLFLPNIVFIEDSEVGHFKALLLLSNDIGSLDPLW